MSRFEKLAISLRLGTGVGALAYFGWYLVNWLGKQNLHTWSGASQLWAALGILGWLIGLAATVGNLADDVDEFGWIWLVTFLPTAVSAWWLSFVILWIGPNSQTLHDGAWRFNGLFGVGFVLGVLVSVVALVTTCWAVDEVW